MHFKQLKGRSHELSLVSNIPSHRAVQQPAGEKLCFFSWVVLAVVAGARALPERTPVNRSQNLIPLRDQARRR